MPVELFTASAGGSDALGKDYLWMPIVAGFTMFYMAWGIGANDVANAFATSFGAKSITLKQAIMVATFCEFLGSFALGAEVSSTIRKGIVSIDNFRGDDGRLTIMCGMMSALLASALWLHLASKLALPVSTTHTIVGGVIGFVVVSRGYDAVEWGTITEIVASWLISPLLSSFFAAISWALLKTWLYASNLSEETRVQRAKAAIPALTCLTWAIVIVFMIYKGAKGLGISDTPLGKAVGIGFAFGACFAVFAYLAVGRLMPRWRAAVANDEEAARSDMMGTVGGDNTSRGEMSQVVLRDSFILEALDTQSGSFFDAATSDNLDLDLPPASKMAELGNDGDGRPTAPLAAGGRMAGDDTAFESKMVEMMFRPLNVLTAAFESFAHGANDVANSIGPFNAVVAAYNAPLDETNQMPEWILVVGGLGIVLGLWTYGERVMRTMGKDITYVTPSRAFCIELSATFTILFATNLKLPVSTTHASVGAVIGVGVVDNVKTVNWGVLRGVFTSWLTTLPAAALTTASIFGFLLPAVTTVFEQCPAQGNITTPAVA